MNARIPLPDWRDALRSIPTARFDGKDIKPVPKTIDALEDELARSAVEKISDRPAKESRFKGRATA